MSGRDQDLLGRDQPIIFLDFINCKSQISLSLITHFIEHGLHKTENKIICE